MPMELVAKWVCFQLLFREMCESMAKFEKIAGSRDEYLEMCGTRFSAQLQLQL